MKKVIYTVLSVILATATLVALVAGTRAADSHTCLVSHKHTAKHGTIQATSKINHVASITQNSATADVYPVVAPGLSTLTPAQVQQAASASKAGQEALAAGKLSEAEVDFRQATQWPELYPSNTAALVGLAQTLEQEGKNQEAIKVYRYFLYPKQGWQTSLEDDPMLRMHFALLLANDKQWPEAVSVYESTINTVSLGTAYPSLNTHFSPDTPEPALFQALVHLVMGITHNNRLEHPEALVEYQAAINAQPDLAVARYYHGQGLQRLGRREEAQADFAKAAALGEGDVKKAAQSPNSLLLP